MPLANCDWNEKIKNKSTIYDEKSLMKILTSLIKGFSYIQKNKIAHRDIKPANILILNDNEYCITDFGESGSSGHFTAYCRNSLDDSLFLCYNDAFVSKVSILDSMVSKVAERAEEKRTPYILLYHY
jgi:serine/threonine protein kinase